MPVLPLSRLFIMSDFKSDVTVVIPVKNEEQNLPSCLQAIGSDFAHHVVVIDSNSCDSTVLIAKDMGAEVIDFQWNGFFPKKRNWFLANYALKSRWVLFLDADEILNVKVKREIHAALQSTAHQGFQLSYSNYFMGKRLRGGVPLQKVALFKVGKIRYERIEEDHWSQCDMEVHEHPIIDGSIGRIYSNIDHVDLRGIDSYMNKHNEYAAWEAKRIFSILTTNPCLSNLSKKQRLKYYLMQSPYGGFFYFLINYVFMGAWKDGSYGFAFSLFKASYFTQVACRLSENFNVIKKNNNYNLSYVLLCLSAVTLYRA